MSVEMAGLVSESLLRHTSDLCPKGTNEAFTHK
jgi:hypothetical protein